jgi:type 1 glutamine amidotransferase
LVRWLLALSLALGCGPAGATSPVPELVTSHSRAPAEDTFSVLIFSKTAGYRHASITDGIAAITQLGQASGFDVDATEDATIFTSTQLAGYAVVVFLNTTGDVLDAGQQSAFEQFIQAGGGFVGVHSASDTEYGWPWYGGLVGAYFAGHPAIQPATVEVVEAAHLSTQPLPAEWTRTDEWYNFAQLPAAGINVLLRVDEGSYSGGTMGANHPIAWYQAYDGGRAWYTAMGHTAASYAEPAFRAHLRGGILWAAGRDLIWLHLPLLLR